MANADIVRNAAGVVSLDRELAEYGPETQGVRALLKRTYATTMKILASSNPPSLQDPAAQNRRSGGRPAALTESSFSTHSEEQHRRQVHTIQIINDLSAARWGGAARGEGCNPLAPADRSGVVVGPDLWHVWPVCPPQWGDHCSPGDWRVVDLWAIFLILEMNAPRSGVI